MVKSDRSGQAAILTSEQFDALMEQMQPLGRAIFNTARNTAGRISEVLSLKWSNIYDDCLVFPKAITKKKVRTREIPLNPKLKAELSLWKAAWPELYQREATPGDYVFPMKGDFSRHVLRRYADRLLRAACEKVGILGCSTHSMRRSALSSLYQRGVWN
jgi:integrase/recombinase XerD